MSVVEIGLAKHGELTEIGRGSSGTVYRARQPEFDRDIAIKILRADPDPASLERFTAECAAIGSLSGHPNIVTVYELGVTEDDRPYIVMEFLPGGSLSERLTEDGPLDWPDVLAIAVKLAGTLESAHQAGVLHRDVKPENVLFSRFGDLKLVDFGVAQVAGRHESASGGLIGTPAHAAPELLQGKPASPQTEVYALASTLYMLMTGHSPAARAGDSNLVRLTTVATEASVRELDDLDAPAQMRLLLECAISIDPSQRPSSAAQFGRQLQAVQAGHGLTITRLPIEVGDAETERSPRVAGVRARAGFGRRLRRWWAVALGATALIGIAIALVISRPDDGPLELAPLFGDNFDAGEGWYEHSDDDASLGYDEGRYRITVKRSDHQAISDTSFRGPTFGVPLTALRDVSVQVSAHALSGSGLVGVTCRQEAGAASYYEGLVGTDGGAQIAKYANGELVTLSRARVPPLDPSRPSRLRLDCIGEPESTRVTFFVGSRPVTAVTDRDGLVRGSVGLAVASGDSASADAVFDDLGVFTRSGGGS